MSFWRAPRTSSATAASAIAIVFRLEAEPRILTDCLSESEERRLRDWLSQDEDLAALFEFASLIAESRRRKLA